MLAVGDIKSFDLVTSLKVELSWISCLSKKPSVNKKCFFEYFRACSKKTSSSEPWPCKIPILPSPLRTFYRIAYWCCEPLTKAQLCQILSYKNTYPWKNTYFYMILKGRWIVVSSRYLYWYCVVGFSKYSENSESFFLYIPGFS